MANKTDQKTLDLIKEVARRKKEIAQTEKYHYVTNCSFSYIEGSATNVVNLHVEKDIKKLISITAFLVERKKSYIDAWLNVLRLVGAPDFTWEGFTVEDWISDIKARIAKVQISSKKKSLDKLESRLNAIISPELRAELELQAIADELG
jgi:hypothetical protein